MFFKKKNKKKEKINKTEEEQIKYKIAYTPMELIEASHRIMMEMKKEEEKER